MKLWVLFLEEEYVFLAEIYFEVEETKVMGVCSSLTALSCTSSLISLVWLCHGWLSIEDIFCCL